MVYTNFPNGITSLGVPVIGSGQLPITSGTYWFVSSVIGGTGNPGTADAPFATLMGAVNAAASGDIIVLLPNHAETISTAAGVLIATAGLTIVGQGEGATRPTFTFSTSTAATFRITGASCSISNIVGICNIDQIVSPFVIAAADCTLGMPGAPVEWHDGAANKEALRAVLTTAAAARLNVNLNYFGFTAGSHVVNAVRLVGVATGNITVNFYGILTTAVVEFVTTACTNIQVYGYMYVSGTTNYTKDVVDTVTGSTWYASFFDGSAGLSIAGGSGAALGPATSGTVIADLAVPTADATTNLLERDVIGNKTDTGVTAVGTNKSITAYSKGQVTMLTVQSADSTNNAFAGDVVGNKTDASVYVPGTTKSIAAYVKGVADFQERAAVSATAVLATGTTIFTIAGGPIQVVSLISECVVGGDATAATIQYSATATGLAAQTFSGASGSVANAGAHATVTLIGTALATAAVYNSTGTNLGMTTNGGISLNVGVVTTTIGSGPTVTGTWRHILRYRPLTAGVTVS